MPKTIQSTLSDAAIKRHFLMPEVREIKDTRHPIRLRINQSRTKATWYVVVYKNNKAIWKKVGYWPDVSCRSFIQKLPDILAALQIEPDKNIRAKYEFQTVGEVCTWYINRSEKNRALSDERKSGLKAAVKNQIVPTLGGVLVADLTKPLIDERMMQPLQSKYETSTVNQAWRILKTMIKRAHELSLIESNPLLTFKFVDFITTKIQPKAAKLKPSDVAIVDDSLDCKTTKPQARFLVLLMLMHGTRIGETRKARWEHFDIDGGFWNIPTSDTKTKEPHRLPLTDESKQLLIHFGRLKNKSGFLFPSSNKSKCISARVATDWVGSIARGKWTAHDLRKLARTAWQDLGTDYMVCEFLLNHKLSGLNKTYIHTHAESQKRECLKKYHKWLLMLENYASITKT